MPARKRRPRGYIEELPSGSFRAVVYAGVDPLTGKPQYLRETAKRYADAEVALTRLLGQVDEDRHPKTAITVGRAVAQQHTPLADNPATAALAAIVGASRPHLHQLFRYPLGTRHG